MLVYVCDLSFTGGFEVKIHNRDQFLILLVERWHITIFQNIRRKKNKQTNKDNEWTLHSSICDLLFALLFTRSTKTPARLLRQLDPMFQIDPLFKRTFLLSLPIRDISEILEGSNFLLYEVCWTLTRIVQERDTPYLSDEEVGLSTTKENPIVV